MHMRQRCENGSLRYETPDPALTDLILTIFKNRKWFHLCLVLAIPNVMTLCVSYLAV